MHLVAFVRKTRTAEDGGTGVKGFLRYHRRCSRDRQLSAFPRRWGWESINPPCNITPHECGFLAACALVVACSALHTGFQAPLNPLGLRSSSVETKTPVVSRRRSIKPDVPRLWVVVVYPSVKLPPAIGFRTPFFFALAFNREPYSYLVMRVHALGVS